MKRVKGIQGFTLIEMIVAMVITGIIAAMVSVFMVAPIKGYQDTVRRAGLSDAADTALKRMAMEIRSALPNSVRLKSNQELEFIPTTDGGRYRADGPGDPLNFDFSGSCSGVQCSFDVLGPPVTLTTGDQVVVFNTGQPGLDAYAGDNRRASSTTGSSVTSITVSGAAFPFESPTARFHIVHGAHDPAVTGPETIGPVTFACTDRELRRHTGYATGTGDWNSTSGLGTGNLLAEGADCYFDYQAVSVENGLVTLRLTLTSGGESVTLHQQLHVDNSP